MFLSQPSLGVPQQPSPTSAATSERVSIPAKLGVPQQLGEPSGGRHYIVEFLSQPCWGYLSRVCAGDKPSCFGFYPSQAGGTSAGGNDFRANNYLQFLSQPCWRCLSRSPQRIPLTLRCFYPSQAGGASAAQGVLSVDVIPSFYPSRAGGASSGHSRRKINQQRKFLSQPSWGCLVRSPHDLILIFMIGFYPSRAGGASSGYPHSNGICNRKFQGHFPRQVHLSVNQDRTNKVQEIENASLIQFYQCLIHFPRQKTVLAIFVVSAYGLKRPILRTSDYPVPAFLQFL